MLARAGCDVGLKDRDGKTGRQLAEAEGHAAVLARRRAVAADQLRPAQGAAGPAPELEPEPAAVDGQWIRLAGPGRLGAAKRPSRFPIGNQFCMALLYDDGHAGRLPAQNGGFRPGQWPVTGDRQTVC